MEHVDTHKIACDSFDCFAYCSGSLVDVDFTKRPITPFSNRRRSQFLKLKKNKLIRIFLHFTSRICDQSVWSVRLEFLSFQRLIYRSEIVGLFTSRQTETQVVVVGCRVGFFPIVFLFYFGTQSLLWFSFGHLCCCFGP
jgi:hypothetical protein